MRGLSKCNVNYLLTFVDVFSNRLFVKALQRKEGNEVTKAYDDISTEVIKTPRCLQIDKDTEFTGAKTKPLYTRYGIEYVTSQNPNVKAIVVERVNATLKTRMW